MNNNNPQKFYDHARRNIEKMGGPTDSNKGYKRFTSNVGNGEPLLKAPHPYKPLPKLPPVKK
jgi:hypothetical protein